jgi:hypothetical protein
MSPNHIRWAAVATIAIVIAVLSIAALAGLGRDDSAAAETAVQSAFGAAVNCSLDGSTSAGQPEYGCYGEGTGPGFPLDAGCVESDGDDGSTYFSCFGPDFTGECIRRRGERFSVVPRPTLNDPPTTETCPVHSVHERVSLPQGLMVVQGWDIEGSSDSDVWVKADVRFCARDAVWTVSGSDFSIRVSDGRTFGSGYGSWIVQPGHCLTEPLTFDAADAVDAYNPPTFVFHPTGGPPVEWNDVPQPS